jgi:catechol 2,3-dioxygenase-like lactoylglutathione lyase family enzyme
MVESRPMLKNVRRVDYVIVLCEDLEGMIAFYRGLFDFPVVSQRADVLAMDAGPVTFCLRKRIRRYDGRSAGPGSPGVQIAFRVPPGQVDPCHKELVQKGVTIFDPPTDQPWGHRTVYFSDPEGNILELYEER